MSAKRQPRAKPIEESELARFRDLQAETRHLAREAERQRVVVTQLEGELLARLAAGARVRGRLTAVVEREIECHPSYLEELVDHFLTHHGVQREALLETVRARARKEVDKLKVGRKPGPEAVK